MTREQLKTYLIRTAEYPAAQVETWSNETLIDKYLMYEGICGFTYDIISTVLNVYNTKKTIYD